MNAFLLLGRNGDILNLLPLLKQEAEKANAPVPLVVSKDYAALLEGVSYVRPLVYPGHFSQAGAAARWAKPHLPEHKLKICAPYATDFATSKSSWSFDRELWIRADDATPPHSLPLIFDRRNPEREAQLAEQTLPKDGRPIVLLALKGASSPFPYAQQFSNNLQALLPGHAFVDISDLKAHRLYDLLGLFDRAKALVAIDSAPLHLAAACPGLVTAALVVDGPTPWHQSSWRPHHNIRVPYSMALTRVQDIANTVAEPDEARPMVTLASSLADNPPESTWLRHVVARQSWTRELGSGWLKRQSWLVPTRTTKAMGDGSLPFVRDMIDHTLRVPTAQHDIIVLTNADISFAPGLTGEILDACFRYGCAHAHRWDFTKLSRPPNNEVEIRKGRWYPGSDLFAFTKQWWDKHDPLFPDMLLGREGWDMIMRNLMKRSVQPQHRAAIEIQHGIAHEKHASAWEQNRELPGNVHNRRLAEQWLREHGGHWEDWRLPHDKLQYR